MKWAAISRRERRMVTLGVLAIAAVLLVARVLPLWKATRSELLSEAAEAKHGVRLANRLISAEDWLRDSATSRGTAFINLAASVLDERSVGAAGAELAELINGAAADAGVRVGTAHVLSDTVRHALFQQVAVRTAVTGDIAGVMRLVASLEGGPIALAIRELAITQMNVSSGDREPEMLRAELVVAALMRPTGAQ